MDIITEETLKASQPVKEEVYQNLSASKQRFDQIRRLQAINGEVVLRGKQGRRDKVYPLALAIKRFSKWFVICRSWHEKGFTGQTQELKLVLQQLGAKIVEAIVQRQTGALSITPMPPFVDTKFVLQLQAYITQLKTF